MAQIASQWLGKPGGDKRDAPRDKGEFNHLRFFALPFFIWSLAVWDNKLPANFFFFFFFLGRAAPCFRCSLKWKREGALTRHSLLACGRRCLFRKRQESKKLKRGEADWAADWAVVRRERRTKFPKAKTEALVLYTYAFYSSHTNDVTMMPHNATPIADIFFSFRRANTASRRIWSVKGWISRPTGFLQSRTPPVHSLHSGLCLQAVFIESLHLLAPPFHDGGIDSPHHLSGHFIRMKSVGWSRSFDFGSYWHESLCAVVDVRLS